MKRLLAAALFALAGVAHADVLTFERAEYVSASINESQSRLLSSAEQLEWTPVALPHLWFRDQPPVYTSLWYRVPFQLEHAPKAGQSLYFPKLTLSEITVYVNRQPIWKLSDVYRPGVPLSAVHIPIPPELLRTGENTLHLFASGDAKRFHGVSRIHLGDTATLAEHAAMRSLVQEHTGNLFVAAFGAIGLLSLWLWLRAGRDPVLFWYGVSGATLLAATLVWYVAMWRPEFQGWRTGLLFMRYHGYLVPFFILHLRIAGRRHLWLESALWIVLVYAFVRISSTGAASAYAWFGWGIAFSVLPALLTVPLLLTPRLRSKPTVLLLVVADFAACVLPLHDWAARLGVLDFDRPDLVYFAPPFVMLAAAAPIIERVQAGMRATAQQRRELERRVAEKTHEIEASHAHLRLAQREQELAAERRRIMADMHDGLGARLVSLLSIAQSGKARHGEISEGLVAALNELRLTVDSVQPVEGDVAVVLGNVRHRMRSVFERAGVKFLWNVSALPRMENLTPERILAIQRIFLEVFSNTLRHAGARTVAVSAVRLPGAVQIVIADDGCGFDDDAAHPGNGLANLRLRAAQAGGTLVVESEPGSGTRVTLLLPATDEQTPGLPGTGQKDAAYPVRGISPAPDSA